MPTLNVYVTRDLRAEMREFDLNWSSIAAAAFRSAIDAENDAVRARPRCKKPSEFECVTARRDLLEQTNHRDSENQHGY
jgi:hypothetical protein